MAKRSHRFLLSGSTDSNIDALVNCLIEDKGIFQVVAGDHPDGYEIRVIFEKEIEKEKADGYLSEIIPKRFGVIRKG